MRSDNALEFGEGVAGFEIQFNWEGAERHVLWRARLRQLDKGVWQAEWNGEVDRFWTVPQ